jgi:hypothetical protein
MPNFAQSLLTDDLMRGEVTSGLTDRDIAQKYAVSRQAVTQRRHRLQLTTVAAAAVYQQQDAGKRFVGETVNVIESLQRSMARMQWMLDADEAWLADPVTGKVDLNPRANEIEVIYLTPDESGEKMVRRKDTLQKLLNLALDDGGMIYESWESNVADPRTNITKHTAEVRKTVDSMTALYEKMYFQRALETMYRKVQDILDDVDTKVGTEYKHELVRAFKRVFVLDMEPRDSEDRR